MKLENKVAIITGGTKGIGYGIAEEYLKEGAKITICSRNAQEGVKAQEIDTLNIYQAAKQSMQMCLTHLSAAPDAALTDAMPLSLVGIPVKDLVHGDARSAAIAAASIIAKVTRDRIMVELDQTYPGYGFSSNKGYGSKAHLDALAALT